MKNTVSLCGFSGRSSSRCRRTAVGRRAEAHDAERARHARRPGRPARQILRNGRASARRRSSTATSSSVRRHARAARRAREGQALDILLRSAAGYIVAPRAGWRRPARRVYDRIMILATSRAARGHRQRYAAARSQPSAQPQPMLPPVDDDDDDDADAEPESAAGHPGPGPAPVPRRAAMPDPQSDAAAGSAAAAGTAPAGPMTAPRPGLLPAAQPNQASRTRTRPARFVRPYPTAVRGPAAVRQVTQAALGWLRYG